jgi:hypothetical protein
LNVALIQSGTETAPGWLALLLYLVPAAVALGIVVVLIRRRLRRREKAEMDGGRR